MENKNAMGKMLGDSEMEKAAGGGGVEVPPNPQLDIDGKVLVPGGDVGRDDDPHYGDIIHWNNNVQPVEDEWGNIDGC